MTQQTQEQKHQDFSLQVLLQEYANAVQLYISTIRVTHMRTYGLLTAHAALTAVFFTTSQQWQLLVATIGLVFAIFSILVVEHVWLFIIFRIKQVKELEKLLKTHLPWFHSKNLGLD